MSLWSWKKRKIELVDIDRNLEAKEPMFTSPIKELGLVFSLIERNRDSDDAEEVPWEMI